MRLEGVHEPGERKGWRRERKDGGGALDHSQFDLYVLGSSKYVNFFYPLELYPKGPGGKPVYEVINV